MIFDTKNLGIVVVLCVYIYIYMYIYIYICGVMQGLHHSQ